ncbi:MAG TPA: DUF3047 domain-containing protein [Ramlibacter sp.]|nr:DUF3047 domain-containing protein [Ramlibacter sp.]
MPPAVPPTIADSPWAGASTVAGVVGSADAWRHWRLPGKAEVRFVPVTVNGRHALAASADAAASVVRRKVRVEPEALGLVRFSWKVPELIAGADLAAREVADAPVRIVLTFDGDRSRFSAKDAMLAELVRAVTGEEMPYATLMYVWANQQPVDSLVHSPRTGRIRKIAAESGPARLGQWLDYERDVRADFERAFGEPPGPLVGIAVMTDSDNTRTSVKAWYGPVRLESRGDAQAAR